MDALLDKIIIFIKKNEELNEDEEQIIRYGLEVLLLKIIFFLGAVLVGVLCNQALECILFMAFFVPMRSVTGGYHADTRWKCALLSMGTLAGAFGMFCYMKAFDWIANGLLILCILFWILLWKLSPVDTEHKRLTVDEQNMIRKKARIVLIIEAMVLMTTHILQFDRLRNCIIVAILISGILLLIGYYSLYIRKSEHDMGK